MFDQWNCMVSVNNVACLLLKEIQLVSLVGFVEADVRHRHVLRIAVSQTCKATKDERTSHIV
jgi:hypothetical protein